MSVLSKILLCVTLLTGSVFFAAPTYPPMPKEVKVGAYHYQILRSKDAFRCGGVVAVGCTERDIEHITIVTGMSHTAEQATLMHEVEHAIANNAVNESSISEEMWVENTSATMLQVLQDNPELVTYLTAK